MIDVDFAALIDYFGDDPGTHSIVLYMESIGDVRSFLSAARAVARTKPIIVVKAGRTEAAAKAAASHTGALAGSDAVFDAALRRAGVLRVESIFRSVQHGRNPGDAAAAQRAGAGDRHQCRRPRRHGDRCPHDRGRHVGGPKRRHPVALDSFLPAFWSHANPIDILGDATPERYRRAVEVCARDPNIQGLLILLAPQAMTDPAETAKLLTPFARLEGKPVLASWMGGEAVRAGRDVLQSAGLPSFDTPEAAVRAFLHMVRFRRAQEQLYETPAAVPEVRPDGPVVRGLIGSVRREGRRLLTEAEAKRLLAAYDLPVVQTTPATTADDAIAVAEKTGFPVVVKLLSHSITHKSDAGGVHLNLADAVAVRRAFDAIREGAIGYADAHGLSPVGAFAGVTVQPMIRADGYELILGSSIDTQFGPVILFGAGGVLVEVLKDSALGLPPLTRALARQMMERTTIFKALQGVRGRCPVDPDLLETVLVRFSRLVADLPEVQEIDINPLLAGPDQIVALDARVLLAEKDSPPPALAILPYPNQYTELFRTADDSEVTIRVIRPEDEPLIVEHHEQLSEQTIRRRFFGMVRHLLCDRLIRLCHLDYNREMALVAVHEDATGPHILGVSRYSRDPETGDAEFAVVVSDPNQGRGLGHHLMERLIVVARERGVTRLTGIVLRDNQPMLELLAHLRFKVEPTDDPTTVEAIMDLAAGV